MQSFLRMTSSAFKAELSVINIWPVLRTSRTGKADDLCTTAMASLAVRPPRVPAICSQSDKNGVERGRPEIPLEMGVF